MSNSEGSRNPWEVLGLQPGADESSIKHSFRQKALRVHPDVGGSAEEFKHLYRAYEACLRECGEVVIDLDEIFEGMGLADLIRALNLDPIFRDLSSLIGMRVVFKCTASPKGSQDNDFNNLSGGIEK